MNIAVKRGLAGTFGADVLSTCTYCLLQVLMEGMGHIRDVIVGLDGLPYVALNQPNGQIYRLRPVH